MNRFLLLFLSGLLVAGCSSPGVVTSYYTNGEKKEMLVKNGVSIQWNTDKSIRNQCEFKNWKPYDGCWITDWRRNLLHEECEYKDGRRHGDRIIYNWKGQPKWGRGYYMGVVARKMTYRYGKLWEVEEYQERIEKVNRKAEKLARKVEERQRKRLEKEKRKREARERKEAERKKKIQEREEERKRRAREREEAGKKEQEEKEIDGGEDLSEEVFSLEKRVKEQEVLLENLEKEEEKHGEE
ncbi:MAG: hypothetical protein P9M00_02065 [Candidatus Tritonobacter lacicola]|nr:hypothetical protein [Candidatus Tritonobacter lacicola]